jgi:hypothetical protein
MWKKQKKMKTFNVTEKDENGDAGRRDGQVKRTRKEYRSMEGRR